MKQYLTAIGRFLRAMTATPREFVEAQRVVPSVCASYQFSRHYGDAEIRGEVAAISSENPLWDYFCSHKEGRGIWKWEHYFGVYHRHFRNFVGKDVGVLEIGIYAGGSLGMWRSYFGEKSRIYGVDIQEECKLYEDDHTTVFIGDQADRAFWRAFKREVQSVDIVIDDGGHTPEQQQITLEEMLPHIRAGGVYVCEDIHGRTNRFAAYASSLVQELNAMSDSADPSSPGGVSQFQSSIYSIHFYPYLVVIEKHAAPLRRLIAPRHGTQWQPF